MLDPVDFQARNIKSGFVAILGKPNVGKSTLLNYYLEKKIAPVANKPQTTRQMIHGIRNDDDSQIIFVDTPGIHLPKDTLGKIMLKDARSSITDADILLFLIDPKLPDYASEKVIDNFKKYKGPVFLVLNKIDGIKDKQEILPVFERYQELFNFKEYVPISALNGVQMDVLLKLVKESLPEGHPYFPEDMLSDKPTRDIIKELIREKIVRATKQEIPYTTEVVIEEFQDDTQKKITRIHAMVVVEHESQKGILIGKGGSMLKKIGTEARKDLEDFLEQKVFLKLWVKVIPGWKNDPFRLKSFGYDA